MYRVKKILGIFGFMFLVLCFMGMAGVNEVADVSIGSYGVHFLPKVSYGKLTLSVSRPDGTVFSKTFEAGISPYFDLSQNSGVVIEGNYNYELQVTPLTTKIRGTGKNLPKARLQGNLMSQSGSFSVLGGTIVTPGASEAGGRPFVTQGDPATPSDQVILDDLIVTGSACIGFDCVNGESFGFDTLRLKENNLRIKFQDTSSTAAFPTNDWQITANDSASGGANKFSIDDIDSGRTPFTIKAGTRANAIFVDDSGRVGFGTSTPSEDLHIWYGDTPTIRLAQSGSGWAPQTWDVAGNEANFFIRDVTNSSKLPFRIQPSAPTNSLFIKSDGKVGLGTQSPEFELEVERTGTAARFICDMTNGSTGCMVAGSQYVFIGAKTNHELRFLVNDNPAMIIGTNMYIGIGTTTPNPTYPIEVATANNARLETTGNWVNPSSRELKENIESLTPEEAIETLKGLDPVKYNYKVDKEEGYVGFIAEDVPELVSVKDRKGMVTMDVVAVLTKVVQEQQDTISGLNKRIAELEKKVNSDNK
jgi:hypothetical protein